MSYSLRHTTCDVRKHFFSILVMSVVGKQAEDIDDKLLEFLVDCLHR